MLSKCELGTGNRILLYMLVDRKYAHESHTHMYLLTGRMIKRNL